MKFEFFTDDESQSFCERIVRAMDLLYDINEETSLMLLNKRWQNHDWRDPSKGGMDENYFLLYHEDERDWAARIGNPRPVTNDLAHDDWEIREEEAERRLSEIRDAGNHAWL